MLRIAIVALALTASMAHAQQAPARYLLQANPFGIVTFGPTVEVLVPASPRFVAAVGARIVSLGLVPHSNAAAEGDRLNFSWMASLSVLYHEQDGMLGWFGGPRVEFGRGTTLMYDDRYSAYVGEFGYRWAIGADYTVSFGGALGVAMDQYEHHTVTGDRGTDYFVFGGLGVNVGWFFGTRR